GGARVAAEQDRGPGGDGALAGRLADRGDDAVPQLDLGDGGGALDGAGPGVGAPQRGEQADAVRLNELVELGEGDGRTALDGGGALEVHLDHAPDAVGADRDGIVVTGRRRLDELPVLHADALRGAGGAGVEEVALDGGDGARAPRGPRQRRGTGGPARARPAGAPAAADA